MRKEKSSHVALRIKLLKRAVKRAQNKYAAQKRHPEQIPHTLFWSLFSTQIESLRFEKARTRFKR